LGGGEGVCPDPRFFDNIVRRSAIKNPLGRHLLYNGIIQKEVQIATVLKRVMEREIGFGERKMV